MDALHALTVGDVLREHRRSYPGRTAVVDGDVRLTWPELDDRVNRLANALDRVLGCGAGDRILWLGQNSFRVLECLGAAAKLGAMLCPANWRSSAEELAFVIEDLDPALVVWQEAEIGDTVRAARALLPAGVGPGPAGWRQHDAGGDPTDAGDPTGRGAPPPDSYEALLADPVTDATDALPHPCTDPDTPLLLLYTAAFAGRPSAAMLSHRAILAQDMVMGMMQEISNQYVYLNSGPLFHVATFMTTLATFHFGGTNVFTPRVQAEELCRLIETERCTGAFLQGPTIKEMTLLAEEHPYDLSSLRAFPGHPRWNALVTPDTSPWARNPTGFGQTECMGMLTLDAWGLGSIGSAGRPHPLTRVRIVDPEGAEVPDGETGEIVASGPTIHSGYWNRPDLTAERLRDGWHHTNDLGRREADGSITFVGPRTRIIKSAAENIYPAEVEACIRLHPGVADVAVIGVPDPTWTQSVKAIVVRRPTDPGDEPVTAEAIVEHCRTSIASYKKPRLVEFVDELPRQGWAVDYDALDAAFGGGGYPGSG